MVIKTYQRGGYTSLNILFPFENEALQLFVTSQVVRSQTEFHAIQPELVGTLFFGCDESTKNFSNRDFYTSLKKTVLSRINY